jgi:hypothetical protein
MDIVLGYGSGNAVQVSRSFSQLVLNSNYRDRRPVCVLGKLACKTVTIQQQSKFSFAAMYQANP